MSDNMKIHYEDLTRISQTASEAYAAVANDLNRIQYTLAELSRTGLVGADGTAVANKGTELQGSGTTLTYRSQEAANDLNTYGHVTGEGAQTNAANVMSLEV